MLKIFLSGLQENYKFNQFISGFVRRNHNLLTIDCTIAGVFGSFPYNYWSGAINTNDGKLMLYHKIADFQKDSNYPIILDYSNINLTDDDLTSIQQNATLDIFENCGASIEFSLIPLMEYIDNKFKNYNFIVSDKIDLIQPLTDNIINAFTENDKIKYLVLPSRLNDNCSNLKNKSKIIINMLDNCNGCYRKDDCKQIEMLNQYNFSSSSIFKTCQACNSIGPHNFLEKMNYYRDLGFSNFKFEFPTKPNLINGYNKIIIDNLVREEHQNFAYKRWLDEQ